MEEIGKHDDVMDNESSEEDIVKQEAVQSNGALHYAFVYCIIFLLGLLVAAQFEPLIAHRYPLLILVAAVVLLFIGATLQEAGKQRAPPSKKQAFLVVIALIILTCFVLTLMIIPESPVLTLLVPLAVAMLILEWFMTRCEIQDDST